MNSVIHYLKIAFVVMIGITAGLGIGMYVGSQKQADKIVEERMESLSMIPLSDWQILELAIMKTESDFNVYAKGSKDDLGLFQITEVYVKECNRIRGESTWVHTDAFVPARALEMFNVYQDSHNPSHDYIRAINVHNPHGGSIGYSQKVLNNINYIRNYENIRSTVLGFTK